MARPDVPVLDATRASRLAPGPYAPPPAERCRNCGTPLAGAYCAACGQRDAPADPTLRDLVQELVENVLNVDGRVATTFWTLVRRPGQLTVEFLRGRRAPFFSPLRVYLLCSVLYFAVAAVTPDPLRTISRPSGDVATLQASGARVRVTGVSAEDSAGIARVIEGMRRSPRSRRARRPTRSW